MKNVIGSAIAILAAGKGTRLRSKRAKVLHEIGGKPLLQHVVDAALTSTPPEQIFVVVGHQAEEV
ncbi:MAG TPA: NTP transferase domain-containing protein, partial [Acidobacteriaceae bacterium]|nr:NTP transferase domain-containing protein [Acidobacteriaceae bacterium]